jgi:hypothetical protein
MAYVKNPERQANKGIDLGYAELDSSGNVPTNELGNKGGVASSTTFLRGDQQWINPSASIVVPVKFIDQTYSPYRLLTTDGVILADCTLGNIIVYIPNGFSAGVGKVYTIKKIDSTSNTLSGDTHLSFCSIDGTTSYPLTEQYDSITIVADASGNWDII